MGDSDDEAALEAMREAEMMMGGRGGPAMPTMMGVQRRTLPFSRPD